jgi:nitrate reductase NapD
MSIASLVLKAHPQTAATLEQRISSFPGAEVHAVTPEGQLVVTVDLLDDGEAAALVQTLHDLEGVLAASLIYVHHDNVPHEDQIPHEEQTS